MYQIAHLGDDDDEPEFSSAMPLEEGDTFFFAPRALKNLVMVDELHSYAPVLGESLKLFFILSAMRERCGFDFLLSSIYLYLCREAKREEKGPCSILDFSSGTSFH